MCWPYASIPKTLNPQLVDQATEMLATGVRLVQKTGDRKLQSVFLHSLGCVYMQEAKTKLAVQVRFQHWKR